MGDAQLAFAVSSLTLLPADPHADSQQTGITEDRYNNKNNYSGSFCLVSIDFSVT